MREITEKNWRSWGILCAKRVQMRFETDKCLTQINKTWRLCFTKTHIFAFQKIQYRSCNLNVWSNHSSGMVTCMECIGDCIDSWYWKYNICYVIKLFSSFALFFIVSTYAWILDFFKIWYSEANLKNVKSYLLCCRALAHFLQINHSIVKNPHLCLFHTKDAG